MSINYVDKMDNEPVGIKRLVDCHTGKYVQSIAITEWGLGVQWTACWQKMVQKHQVSRNVHVKSYNRKLKQKSK